MTITVDEWYDDSNKLNLTIQWDETDPIESQFNDWTAEDFLTAITNACDKELSMGDATLTTNSERLHLTKQSEGDIS